MGRKSPKIPPPPHHHHWTEEETRAFLKLMRGWGWPPGIFERIKLKHLERVKAMKEISLLLQAQGYQVNPTHVDNRWKSLLAKYRAVEDHNNTSGNDTMAGMPFHDEMDEVCGERASTKPKAIAGSRVPLDESLAPVLSSLPPPRNKSTLVFVPACEQSCSSPSPAPRRQSTSLCGSPAGPGSLSSSSSSVSGSSHQSSPLRVSRDDRGGTELWRRGNPRREWHLGRRQAWRRRRYCSSQWPETARSPTVSTSQAEKEKQGQEEWSYAVGCVISESSGGAREEKAWVVREAACGQNGQARSPHRCTVEEVDLHSLVQTYFLYV